MNFRRLSVVTVAPFAFIVAITPACGSDDSSGQATDGGSTTGSGGSSMGSGGSAVGSGGSAPGQDGGGGAVGDLCVQDKCAAGLMCASANVVPLAGRCTLQCPDQAFCESRFGSQSTCYSSSYCVKRCVTVSDCQGGYCTAQANGDRVCLSN